MSFSVEYSGLAITHLIYKAALILTVVRWIFSSAFRVRCSIGDLIRSGNSDATDYQQLQSLNTEASDDDDDDDDEFGQMMLLHGATIYGDISDRLPKSCTTCAVCLDELKERDKVRELRNCCHVFHKRCIDRWLLNHVDDLLHSTCPVCRAPILRSSTSSDALMTTRLEPSWAVERLLYLFGDDPHSLLL